MAITIRTEYERGEVVVGDDGEVTIPDHLTIEEARAVIIRMGEALAMRRPHRELGFIKPDTKTQVFFYEQDFYVLSNFSAFEIMWKGLRFSTSEAAYHYEKFSSKTVADAGKALEARRAMHTAMSAHDAFKLAEGFRDARRADWDEVKVDIMREILREKAAQHEYVRRKLLATGDRLLVEDSWRDDFWGWGADRQGQNRLGRLWMEIRDEVRMRT